MNRNPSGGPCEAVRGRLIDAAMSAEGFTEGSLDDSTRSHLAECAECRAFLDQILAMKRLAAEEASVAEPDMRAIHAAIDEGMARAAPTGATLVEKVAFLLFALVLVTAQVLLLRRLRPIGVLALEAGLNWVAPFVFYIVFRLDRRARRKGAAS